MEEELGESSQASCISLLEKIPEGSLRDLEEDQIQGLEHRRFEFHAALQEPCTVFMFHWSGYNSNMQNHATATQQFSITGPSITNI